MMLQTDSDFERKTIMMIANCKKWKHVCLAAVIILSMRSTCPSAISGGGIDVRPTPRQLVNLYREAVNCWDKSVAMRVELVHSVMARDTDGTENRRWEFDITHRRDGNRGEWFGTCQYKRNSDGGGSSFNEQFMRMVNDEFFLFYSKRDSKKRPEARMGSNVREWLRILQAQEPDAGFLQGRMGGIGTSAKMVDLMSESDNLEIVGQETVNGIACLVLKAKTKYGTFTAWIAPERGYNAMRYIVRKSDRDVLRDDIHIVDQGITEWTEVADSIDVQEIDGVFVPMSGKLTRKTKSSDAWERTTHVQAKRSEIVLKPDFKALGAFEVRIPDGTKLEHEDFPGLPIRWMNSKFVPDMNRYVIRNQVAKPSTDSELKELVSVKTLEALDLSSMNTSSSGLSCLKEFPHLHFLRVTVDGELDMQHLANLQGLRVLLLTTNPHISDSALRHIAGLKNLEHLSLDGLKVTDEGITHLAGLTSLQVLQLNSGYVTDTGLKKMKDLSSLYSLEVKHGRFTQEVLSWFQKTMPIQYFEVGEWPQNELYDPHADADQQIRIALSRAKQGKKRVLLIYGGNWCVWCKKLAECFANDNEIEVLLEREYEIVRIDAMANEAILERFGTKPDGYPFLTILDANGRVVTHQSTSDFVEEGKHVAVRVYAFLNKWTTRP